MLYLSRGVPVCSPHHDEADISLHGRVYALGPVLASLWEDARGGPKEIVSDNERRILRMAQVGLMVVTDEESERLAAYRLLSQCILCPDRDRRHWLPLIGRDKRLWTWISKAGLRLTTCELIRLEDQRLLPAPAFLGNTNRQALTEAIYTPGRAEDSLLVTAMEHSAVRDATVASLLRLLRTRYLFLA